MQSGHLCALSPFFLSEHFTGSVRDCILAASLWMVMITSGLMIDHFHKAFNCALAKEGGHECPYAAPIARRRSDCRTHREIRATCFATGSVQQCAGAGAVESIKTQLQLQPDLVLCRCASMWGTRAIECVQCWENMCVVQPFTQMHYSRTCEHIDMFTFNCCRWWQFHVQHWPVDFSCTQVACTAFWLTAFPIIVCIKKWMHS